jgi:hypothetical protein
MDMGEKHEGSGGWPGPYWILRRYRRIGSGLGWLYEARNSTTGKAALVLMPGNNPDWGPREAWQVRVVSQVEPPLVALEVERAPEGATLLELAEMLDLMTCAVERVEARPDARLHLAREPEMPESRPVAARRRWLLAGAGAFVAAALVLVVVTSLPRAPELSETKPGMAGAIHQEEVTFANTEDLMLPPIAYPMPERAYKQQKKPPCLKGTEMEIRGGCWLELSARAPCPPSTAEYEGKCYMPVGAKTPEPRVLEP